MTRHTLHAWLLAAMCITSMSAGCVSHETANEKPVGSVVSTDIQDEHALPLARNVILREIVIRESNPSIFHKRLHELSKAISDLPPGQSLRLSLIVPRDGRRRSIATRVARVQQGWVSFESPQGGRLLVHAENLLTMEWPQGGSQDFRWSRAMHMTLHMPRMTHDNTPAEQPAVLIPNAIAPLHDTEGNERADKTRRRSLEWPVELKNDTFVLEMIVTKSSDFKGDFAWWLPAYK